MSNVAVIGAGIMGTAIATRLLQCGHVVNVYDLDTEKLPALVAKGAFAAASAASATQLSDFIILSLNHSDIVRKAVFTLGLIRHTHAER